MGRYGALVSGGFATQFFERVLWKESDLDIYIEKGHEADAFGAYLISKEGYKVSGRSTDHYTTLGGIIEVRNFTRNLEQDSTGLKAQIVVTKSIPLQVILRSSISTAAVNFFSWNKAYSIFPLHTFVRHKGYLLKPLDDSFSSLLDKYSRRGWRFQESMWPEEAAISNQPIQTTRRIGDRFTWMIPFDISKVEWSRNPDSVLEHANFVMDPERDDGRTYYNIKASLFRCEVLRHRYLYGESAANHAHESWMDFLGGRVKSLTFLELYKMAPEARPTSLQKSCLFTCMRNCKKPKSWTYWDDEIPRWYQTWYEAWCKART
ncbi:hypothetical protein MMC07_005975 [Pseudocyphellaria aurata]|nr:hypothetical protein [Pseudocyphellaria aurata]